MSFSAEFSDDIEAQIDQVSKSLDVCRADALRHLIGLGVFLYTESDKGGKVLVKRRWPRKTVEVHLK